MKLLQIIAFIKLANPLFAQEGELPPYHWSNVDLSLFSSRSPERLIESFDGVFEQRPPVETMDEVRDRLARNDEFREWLLRSFEEAPVTWENLRWRKNALWVVKQIPAEWAVRFLMDLRHDQRRMTSTKYDYDDPALHEKIRLWIEKSPSGAADFIDDIGIEAHGRNCEINKNPLVDMKLAGAPEIDEIRRTGVTVIDWLLQPSQRDRIAEICKATWSDKAVLNAELGLGPDNRPLSEGNSPSSSGTSERLPIAERLATPDGDATHAEEPFPWFPLGGALLLVSVATGWWWRRSAGCRGR